MEEREWKKPFRNALDKSDRKKYDEMFGMPTEHRNKGGPGGI